MRTPLSFLLLALLMGTALTSKAQLWGVISDEVTGEDVAGVSLYLIDNQVGVYTEEDGTFAFPEDLSFPDRLVVSMLEYQRDTIDISSSASPLNIALTPTLQEDVVITGSLKPVSISRSPVKVEVISREFIRQVPSNNVTEVLEYVNGVRRQVGCGVCGTADIHLNGMEGPYTLVLIDGMPIMGALASVYGLEGIPNSLVDRIEVVKGPASTIYGSDAVAGTINIITRSPETAPRLFLSGWTNTHRENNLDFSATAKALKGRTMFSGNYYGLHNRIDQNGDNFTDVPLADRLSLFNKWEWDRPGNKKASIAGKYYYEDRFGGTLQWQNEDRGSDSIYGESIITDRFEVMGDYDLPGRENINLKFSFSKHDQDSYYGNTAYVARQNTGFASLVWFKEARGGHNLLFGTAARYQFYDDNTPATTDPVNRMVPGIFVEDEWEVRDNLSLLGGLRYDQHPDHGGILSPRLNMRWKPGSFSTIRLTGGTGFRNVNIFTEEHAALTGARTVIIEGELAPERSYTANLNFNQIFNVGESAATFDADLFYTHFTNKIIPDYDADPNLIIYGNLPGHSIIRGGAVKLSQTFTFPLSYDLGATFMEVYAVDEMGGIEQQEFAPVFSGVFSLTYNLRKLRTRFSYTGRVVGPMALPGFDAPFERPEVSEWFTEQNFLAETDLGRGIGLQMGVRNLLNYTQNSPLVNPADPFSDEFDTAYAYGPVQGRRFFLGLQWALENR